MPSESSQPDCLISGRHRSVKRRPDPKDPFVERAVCQSCGHPIMRSQVSRRWVISAYMGGPSPSLPVPTRTESSLAPY
jgi:hypothetical protein